MAYQHSNRVIEHYDNPILATLTNYEARVLYVIAQKIHRSNPTKMRFSGSHIADLTQSGQRVAQRALAALVAKGALVAIGERSPRQAYAYAIAPALDCPTDCRRLKQHYTPAELVERRERLSEALPEGDLAPVDYDLSVVTNEPKEAVRYDLSVVTNKELINNSINNNKKPSEFAERKTRVDLSFAEFEKVLFDTAGLPGYDSNDHDLVLENRYKAYEVALLVISDYETTNRPVDKPKEFIKRVYGKSPRRLLAGAPGAKPRNPDFIERDRDTSHLTYQDYVVAAISLCEPLGIDYNTDLAATTKEQELWKAFRAGKLTNDLIARAYNSYREPGDWIQPESMNLY